MHNIIVKVHEEIYKKNLRRDIIAGVTVALILIPQSLAYARLAGLPSYVGLYAAILPPLIATLVGSCPQLSTGPVAVLSLMTLTTLSPIAQTESQLYISYAILLAVLLGLILITLGLLKLGNLMSLLSHPVIYGFTNATALIIIATQIPTLFGIKSVYNENLLVSLYRTLFAGSFFSNYATITLSILAIFINVLLNKVSPKFPSILITLVICTFFVWFVNYPVTVVGIIPTNLPRMGFANIDLHHLSTLIKSAFIMAIIGFTESASIAQAISIKTKNRFDINRELIGQGLANIMGGISQGYPVSGSFSRSAISFFSGTQSRVSGLVTALLVMITVLFLSPLLYYIPINVLAVIIVISVLHLIDIRKLLTLWKMNKIDAIIAVLTFILTLIFAPQLEYGIISGVLFSLGYFFYKNTHPRVAFLSMYKDQSLHDSKTYHLDVCTNMAVVRLDAPLFFANTTFFEEEVIKYLAKHESVTHIIFVGTGINEIDLTGVKLLGELIKTLIGSDKNVYFSSLRAPVKEQLEKANIFTLINKEHVFSTTKIAVANVIRELNKKHIHLDNKHCPLKKYTQAPIEDLKLQKSLLLTTVYYYNRLFTKQ